MVDRHDPAFAGSRDDEFEVFQQALNRGPPPACGWHGRVVTRRYDRHGRMFGERIVRSAGILTYHWKIGHMWRGCPISGFYLRRDSDKGEGQPIFQSAGGNSPKMRLLAVQADQNQGYASAQRRQNPTTPLPLRQFL